MRLDPLSDLLRSALLADANEVDLDPGNTALTAIRTRTAGRHRGPGRVGRLLRRTKKPPTSDVAEG